MTAWRVSDRFDPAALPLADRHYNRRAIGSPQFVPPGRCVVLLTRDRDALWVTSWPFAAFVRHAWPGAWVNSLFRNESPELASALKRGLEGGRRMDIRDWQHLIRTELGGQRAVVDEDGLIERLPADAPVAYWVCWRVDESSTWRVMSDQFRGVCSRCGAGIIYRLSAKSPAPETPKVCGRCFVRHLEDTAEDARLS